MTNQAIPTNQDLEDLRDYAEKVLDLYYWCATHENGRISATGQFAYEGAQTLLKRAIGAGWPNLTKSGIEEVYLIWIDCNESIRYCVNVLESGRWDGSTPDALFHP